MKGTRSSKVRRPVSRWTIGALAFVGLVCHTGLLAENPADPSLRRLTSSEIELLFRDVKVTTASPALGANSYERFLSGGRYQFRADRAWMNTTFHVIQDKLCTNSMSPEVFCRHVYVTPDNRIFMVYEGVTDISPIEYFLESM